MSAAKLALIWHQHQPIYRAPDREGPRGRYVLPWVRLHAIRDYYGMAELVRQHPGVHLTINLTPSLLTQLDDYVHGGATDEALELTLTPAERLSSGDRAQLLTRFFDADLAHQVAIHPRYAELHAMRERGSVFEARDLRDLQAWFNLAWFAKELREGDVELVTGERVQVHHLVQKGRDFTTRDLEEIVEAQRIVMRAVLPIHRMLRDRGQLELATTPFYHPILPLLIDSDGATLDREGARLPRRFSHPRDADAQVARAVEAYARWFGAPPRGMWPAEGAVSQAAIGVFAAHGVRWIATDEGVLARSGRWGYVVADPDVACRPYRAEQGDASIAVFFRDRTLSDDLGFQCHRDPLPERAAKAWVERVVARHGACSDDRVVTIVLDGENAWGAYADDGRPFLHAMYAELETRRDVRTVTPSEYLDGSAARETSSHPLSSLRRVYDLFTASWADEPGSAPSVDLGTWIGDAQENRAWELLDDVRRAFDARGFTPATAPDLYEALLIAEGSDWFWWYGNDHLDGRDPLFDVLFRGWIARAHRLLGHTPPPVLARPLSDRPPSEHPFEAAPDDHDGDVSRTHP